MYAIGRDMHANTNREDNMDQAQLTLRVPRQVEPKTLRYWLQTGAYIVTSVGEENTYAINEFGHEVFGKLDT